MIEIFNVPFFEQVSASKKSFSESSWQLLQPHAHPVGYLVMQNRLIASPSVSQAFQRDFMHVFLKLFSLLVGIGKLMWPSLPH